ncbi:16482_t:CDS:1, partial [Racocetra fulgida]
PHVKLNVRLNVDDNDGTSLTENYQSQEDYNTLFSDFNEEKLSDLIDDNSLIEETSLPEFESEEITIELEL